MSSLAKLLKSIKNVQNELILKQYQPWKKFEAYYKSSSSEN